MRPIEAGRIVRLACVVICEVICAAICAAIAAAIVATGAHAQSVSSQVSVAAGSVTDERGIRSNAVSLAPSVLFAPDPLVSIGLAGSASRFADANWQLGASGTVAARTASWSGAALSLNAGGGVSRSSYGATFTLAEAVPAAEWSLGPVTAYGGARIASGETRVENSVAPQGGQTNALSTLSRSSAGPVYGLQWHVADGANGVQAAVGAREERAMVGGERVIDRSVGVSFSAGPVTVNASAIDRDSPSERARFASASASFAIAQGASFDVSGGGYPTNRLIGAAAGRYLSAGFSIRIGGGPRELPVARGVPGPEQGMTRISLRATGATRVELAGDWNDWSPQLARLAADGVWYVDLPLAPGEYRYAFRVDGTEWRVPDDAETAEDGFGGRSAYVTVARAAAKEHNHQEEK